MEHVEVISDDGLTYEVELFVSQRALVDMEHYSRIKSEQCGLGWNFTLERHPLQRTESQEVSASDDDEVGPSLLIAILCSLHIRVEKGSY